MSDDNVKPLFKNPNPPLAPEIKPPSSEELELRKMEEEEAELRRQVELPFLYGWKWYKWAYDFYTSTNRINLLCAANQISKSSTQIRKCINWATDQELWPSLWAQTPVQFWYLYPTSKQTNAEFETKWKLFLPKGEMKDDPRYGWKVEKARGDIVAIHFNSGVHVYFKTYAQNADALQSGTCDAIFCDEELPIEHYDELIFRLSSSDGYFHMVFTATLGQDEWRRAMEPEENDIEYLPDAFKMTVSLYDSMKYMDGSPSKWSLERIKLVESRCSTTNEVLKRVHGKFIVLGGRKYEAFDIKRHMKPAHPIPRDWLIYEGADIGGGGDSHKAALVFVAVRPDFRSGRVFKCWRGDDGVTTAGDVFQKHLEFTGDPNKPPRKMNVTQKWYDWGSKDFGTIATRGGDPFEPAEKSHELGEEVINTLFKNDMLFIYEDEQSVKLGGELTTLKKNENKRKAKDDLADGLRYCVTKIPWDWSFLTGAKSDTDVPLEEELTPMQREISERRKAFTDENDAEARRIEAEFEEANESYGDY